MRVDLFQSTRPTRGATTVRSMSNGGPERFNPRAPRGARLAQGGIVTGFGNVSIHAPHAGRDLLRRHFVPTHAFQSTRPTRGATPLRNAFRSGRSVSIHAPHAGRDLGLCGGCARSSVSIHAPHAGRDARSPQSSSSSARFNPRAPRGARHSLPGETAADKEFQSTRPTRGATLRWRPHLS